MENNQVTEQPTSLLGYIAGQTFQAAPADLAVNDVVDEASSETPTAQSVQNATAAGSEPQQTGVTTQAPGVDVAAYNRLQQEKAEIERQHQQQLDALLVLGRQSGQREAQLFEKSIEHLDEEEQASARQAREMERLKAQNQWLSGTMNAQEQAAQDTQERIDKGLLAQKVHGIAKLPNDPTIFALLMEANSPQEMLVRAQSLGRFYGGLSQQQQAAQAVQAQQRGVHAAGGESAPARPQTETPKRSGDLIGMMRERSYESLAQ